MEENLTNRIGDEYLNPNYLDGQILLNTDVNEIVSIVKAAINANFKDIQRLQNGALEVANALKLNGAELSKSSEGDLEGSDAKVPTSQIVKTYIDAKVKEVIDSIDISSLVEDINNLSTKVDGKIDKNVVSSEKTTGVDKLYNCDYVNNLDEKIAEKLNKSDIISVEEDSTEKTYSCGYINNLNEINKKQNDGSYVKKEQLVTLTQAEYDALEVKDAETYYFIVEGE